MDGYSTLSMDGINKALLGLTTIEEIFRVAPPAHDDAAQVSENVSVKSKISDVNEDASGMLDQPASVGSIRPEKILIVDDNPVDINFLKNILEYHNFITVTASSGDEALKIAFQEKPALIITDYLMPEMDGKVLVTKLKSQLATRFIPIILLTAKDEVDIEVEFFSLGVNDYLTKPFNSKRLIARVCRLLSRPSDAPEYGE
jgi:PleD family two-component response regulator